MRVVVEDSNLRVYDRPGETPVPIDNRIVTWIVVDKDGLLQSTKTITGKCQMLLNAEPSDKFYLAWTGQYSTDIFAVTFKELKVATKDWKIWAKDKLKSKKTRLVKSGRKLTRVEK